jgi:serine-type D-Ala-D-Ala carboxypeptidase/endopeptidase
MTRAEYKFHLAAALGLVLWTSGCGPEAAAPATPVPVAPAPAPAPAPTPPPVTDKWAAVKAALDGFSVANAGVIIGTTSGVQLRYVKGNFKLADTHLVASASKMMAGLTILKMIEDGQMSLTDTPQKYLTYWTANPGDLRSKVTLAQLLAFTSGFNQSETAIDCIGDPNTTLQACARVYYDQGISTTPGTSFVYGNGHLEIAGAMAEIAGGKAFSQLFRDKVANRLAIGPISGITFPSAANPRVAGGGTSTGEEYAKMLEAVLAGRALASLATFQADQTAAVSFLFRPQAATATGDWHYAAASWRECDAPNFNASCAATKIISSPGKFGWTPWIDFDSGYYAIITMEGASDQDSSVISVALEQKLQPLIVAALAAGG